MLSTRWRRPQPLVPVLLGLVALVALLAVPASASSWSPSAVRKAVQNETLVVDTVLVVRTLDPARAQEPGGAMALHHLYSTLLTFEKGNVAKLVPALALNYSVRNNARRFVFNLRPNLRFSDGKPLTSADVVFSLMRLKNLKAQNSFLMENVTATARGPRQVILTTAGPTPALPRILAFEATSILNSAVLRQNGGDSSVDASRKDTAERFLNQTPAGSGPYVLDSASFASQIVFTANTRYWGKKPFFTRVVLRNTVPTQQRLNVIAGDSQLTTDVAGSLLDGLPRSLVIRGSTPDRGFYVEMNMDPAISQTTANPRIREAVRYGLDYKGLFRLARLGGAPMPSVIPANFPGALKVAEGLQRNLQRARSALAASGIANPKITLTYIGGLVFNGISFDAVAQKIKNDLEETRLSIQLEPLTAPAFTQKQQAGRAEMTWRPQRALFVDPATWLLFSPGEQFALRDGYTVARSSRAVVAAAKRARQEVGEAKRLAAFQNWQRLMNRENGPYAPMFGTSTVMVGASNLVGLRPTVAGWRVDFSELSRK